MKRFCRFISRSRKCGASHHNSTKTREFADEHPGTIIVPMRVGCPPIESIKVKPIDLEDMEKDSAYAERRQMTHYTHYRIEWDDPEHGPTDYHYISEEDARDAASRLFRDGLDKVAIYKIEFLEEVENPMKQDTNTENTEETFEVVWVECNTTAEFVSKEEAERVARNLRNADQEVYINKIVRYPLDD